MRPLDLPLEARSKKSFVAGRLVIGGLVISGLFLLGKGAAGGDNGGGNGNTATPAGGIGNIVLSQRSLGNARLGQDLAKQRNDNITVQFTWTRSTTDGAGNPISWPYRLRVWLVNQANQVVAGPIGQTALNGLGNGSSPFSGILTTTSANVFDGDRLRVDITLDAAPTNPDGTPRVGEWVSVDNAVAPTQISIGTGGNSNSCPPPANPSTIGVGQRVYRNTGLRGVISSLHRTASNNAWSVSYQNGTSDTIFDSQLVGNIYYDWAQGSATYGYLYDLYHQVPYVTVAGPGAFIDRNGLQKPVFPGEPGYPTVQC